MALLLYDKLLKQDFLKKKKKKTCTDVITNFRNYVVAIMNCLINAKFQIWTAWLLQKCHQYELMTSICPPLSAYFCRKLLKIPEISVTFTGYTALLSLQVIHGVLALKKNFSTKEIQMYLWSKYILVECFPCVIIWWLAASLLETNEERRKIPVITSKITYIQHQKWKLKRKINQRTNV